MSYFNLHIYIYIFGVNTISPLSSPKLTNRQWSSNALSWLLLNIHGLQNAILIVSTSRSKNPIWQRKKPQVCTPTVLICNSHHISSSRAHNNKLPADIPMLYVFEVQLFSGFVDNITGSRVIPERDTAFAQTTGIIGSNTVSAHRTARSKISTPTSIFWMAYVFCNSRT